MNDTEAEVQRVNSSQQGANGGSTRNSGSSEEFQRDSAQLNLGFNAISSVVLTSTLLVLSLAIILEDNWTIHREMSWIILAVLFIMVVGIFGTTQYAVIKTNRLPLYQPESRKIYTQCFTKLNIIFKAISSLASIFTFVVVSCNVISDSSLKYNGIVIWVIIGGLVVSSGGIIFLTVQTVTKSRSTFQ